MTVDQPGQISMEDRRGQIPVSAVENILARKIGGERERNLGKRVYEKMKLS
jgi:hypothetical protein